MNTVLYTNDMEPITIIDLPLSAQRYLQEHGVVRLAVQMPMNVAFCSAGQAPPPLASSFIRDVTIYADKFIRNGKEHMFLFTHDEENSLLLKSAFLPGQIRDLQKAEKDAFARGFLRAVSLIGQ